MIWHPNQILDFFDFISLFTPEFQLIHIIGHMAVEKLAKGVCNNPDQNQ